MGDKVLTIKSPYLRRSFQTNKRVDEIIFDNLPGTLVLAFAAMLFATVLGITFGMVAALRQNTFWDHSLSSLTELGVSVSSFVTVFLI